MSEETRRRIVEAAVRVLVSDGYAATSVKDIAAEAGVAPGLVHYYFKTKEDLVGAAVAEACGLPVMPGADDPTEAARLAFEQAKHPDERTRQFQSLFYEMLGHARRSDPVRHTLLRTIQTQRAAIETAARAVIATRDDRSPDQAPAVAAVVWAAGFGIDVLRHLDPEFDAAAAVDALAELVLR